MPYTTKKPFKETKFGKVLTEKLPEAAKVVGELLPDNGVLGVAKNLIKFSTISEADKTDLLKQADQFEQEELRLIMEDRKDARDLQKVALQQEDKFSKWFVYILALIVILAAIAFGSMLFFIPVPEENKREIELFSDMFLFGGALMVLNFFYGSSKSSHNKDEAISNSIKKL